MKSPMVAAHTRARRAHTLLTGIAPGLLLLGLVAGCSDSSPTSPVPRPTVTPTPVPASMADLSLTVTPDPVTSTDSGNPSLPLGMRWTLTVRETAGLSGNIDFFNMVFRENSTGAMSQVVNYGADTIVARFGTNHIDPRASRDFVFAYALSRPPGGTHELTITQTMQFTDDRGHVITKTVLVHVV